MATNFLEAAGTNGFITTPFNLMSTELNALATATTATSSVGGTSGVFTQSNYSNAQKCQIYFSSGGAFTPTGAPFLEGWFLFSPDNGTTYELATANTANPRSPDFIIPFNAIAYASGNLVPAYGISRVPWWTNKVFIYSQLGVTLPATGNLIKVGPVADQY